MKFQEAIRQQRFKSPLQKAVLNLIYTANWIRDRQRESFKDEPIQHQHYNIMRILKGRHPHPLSPGDIKAVMLDKAPDLTRLLDRLVDLGWVRREVGAGDRRRVDVSLTDAGVEKLEELNTRVQHASKSFKGKLTDQEAEQLSDLLDKLRE